MKYQLYILIAIFIGGCITKPIKADKPPTISPSEKSSEWKQEFNLGDIAAKYKQWEKAAKHFNNSLELLNNSNQERPSEAYKIFQRIKSTQLLAGKTVGPIVIPVIPKKDTKSLGPRIKLELPVEFKSGGFTIEDLTSKAKDSLLYIADFFKKRKITEIKIIGHTDSKGDAIKNLKLSEKRADSVKKYLKGCVNVEAEFTTEGKGEAEPLLVSNNMEHNLTSDEINQHNRRVEFKY